jgi:hypothetical protein
MECKGINGTVAFDGTFVTIKRTGTLARMTVGKGDKRIPVAEITAVQWKPPGHLIRGFIAFTLAGGIENRSRVGKQTVDAAKDQNSVVIGHTQQAGFAELRKAIEAVIAARYAPAVPTPSTPETVLPDPAEQLRKLNELRDANLLTEEEFQAKRARIVDLL